MVQILPNGDPRLVVLDCGIVYFARNEMEYRSHYSCLPVRKRSRHLTRFPCSYLRRLIDICYAFMKHDGREAGK